VLVLSTAQALACGCPVIASERTWARDLFTHGVEEFIVPIRFARANHPNICSKLPMMVLCVNK
jgi:glycosyltransferase involved in cell wall biosynthesis